MLQPDLRGRAALVSQTIQSGGRSVGSSAWNEREQALSLPAAEGGGQQRDAFRASVLPQVRIQWTRRARLLDLQEREETKDR